VTSRSKPWGIYILAVLISIGGVMDLQNFWWFFIDPTRLLFSSIEVLKWLNFIISLPLGVLSLLAGYAFVKGLRWGYILGIGVLLVGILLNVINLTISGTISPIIVVITITNGVGIHYLQQANGKQHFGT
jgi:hypothetical protein